MPNPKTDDLADDVADDAYDPSDVEVTRGRMQGLGVGARDLERQHDPDRDLASDLDIERPDDSGADPNDTGS